MQLSKYFVATQLLGFNLAYAKFMLNSWLLLSPKSCTLTGVLFGGPELRNSVAQTITLAQSDEAILPHPLKACQQLFSKILNFIKRKLMKK